MNYDLTQTGPEVQGILDKANALPQNPDQVIAAKIDNALNVTYAQLKTLRDGGQLKAGQMYRITDYVTTVAPVINDNCGQQMVRSAGHPFDVLVLAASPASLSETAYATRHDGDTYFQNAHLEAWQLKYALDNDTTRFAWADTENGRGVIYEMEDEWGNCFPFDFKNVQFRHYMIKGTLSVLNDYSEDDEDYGGMLKGFRAMFSTARNNARQDWLGQYMGVHRGYYSEQYIYDDGYTDSWDNVEMEDGGTRMFCMLSDDYDSYAIIAEVDTAKACWCYAVSLHPSLDTTECQDYTLAAPTKCYLNTMAAQISNGVRQLYDNVFLAKNTSCQIYKNTFSGNDISYNVFSGNSINYNVFSGNSINYNVFSGNDISYNVFSGNSIYNNVFSGNDISHNVFSGNDINYNVFSGNNVQYNTFSGSNVWYNTFLGNSINYNVFSGNSIYNNVFSGNNISYNVFSGNEFYRNTFSGNSIYNNVFSGNYVRYNTFSGSNVWYNTFSGDNIYNNVFSGNNVQYNTFSGSSINYNVFLGNTRYCVFGFPMDECSWPSATGSNYVQNVETKGSISGESISVATNSQACIFVGCDSSGDLQVWCPADNA